LLREPRKCLKVQPKITKSRVTNLQIMNALSLHTYSYRECSTSSVIWNSKIKDIFPQSHSQVCDSGASTPQRHQLPFHLLPKAEMFHVFTRRPVSQICLITCQRRCYSPNTRKFDILYMGRDEFSCGVFRELYASPGMSLTIHVSRLCLMPDEQANNTSADIWNSITIATHSDVNIGRRGSWLSVCKLGT
jgi:hypothetical protein